MGSSNQKVKVFAIQPYLLRLALALCLSGRVAEACFVVAVVCSTWSSVNLATSKRDLLCPYGDQRVPSVRSGNRMVARLGGFYLNLNYFLYGFYIFKRYWENNIQNPNVLWFVWRPLQGGTHDSSSFHVGPNMDDREPGEFLPLVTSVAAMGIGPHQTALQQRRSHQTLNLFVVLFRMSFFPL